MKTLKSLPFAVQKAAKVIGENVQRARMRRRMSQDELAAACKITRKTIYSIEAGATGIAVGNLLSVLWALGLLDTATTLADPETDEHGKILEAANQAKRARRPAAIDNDF